MPDRIPERSEIELIEGSYKLVDLPGFIDTLRSIMESAECTGLHIVIDVDILDEKKTHYKMNVKGNGWLYNDDLDELPHESKNPEPARNAAQRILAKIQKCFHKR